MSDKFEENSMKTLRRRKCFYDFSKDYPGTRYDKSKRSSTTYELDGKRIFLRRFLIVLAVLLCFLLSYFVVFTVIGISHESVEGLDSVGATTVSETYTVTDGDIIDMIRERSEQDQPSQDVQGEVGETGTSSDSNILQ